MAKTRYKIETACPQCGCSAVQHLSKEKMLERFKDVPNVEMECGECVLKYTTKMEEACPEWAEECKITS